MTNPNPALRDQLVPSGPPTAGLICGYTNLVAGNPSPVTHRLTATRAAKLTAAIRSIRVGSPGYGSISCPMDNGSVAIIVLGYSGGADVSLWYHDSGCQYLDNGDVVAGEDGNPTFYQGFMPAFTAALAGG